MGRVQPRPAQPQRQPKARPFGNQRRRRDPGHAPAKPQHEPQIQPDVQRVDPQLDRQHRPRPFQRDQPARDRIHRDRRRRPPDPHRQIVARQRLDLGRSRGDAEGQREQRPLRQNEHKPRRQTDAQRALQDRGTLGQIARPLRLRGQPRGPHPQKAEDPVKHRQDHRPDAHRPDRRSQTQLADHPGIDRPQQRDRGIRQHNRQRDAQHAAVRQPRSLSHLRPRPRPASGNARSPARTAGRGCLARPRHARWHSAAPTG